MRIILVSLLVSLAVLSSCAPPPRAASVEPRPPAQRPTVAPPQIVTPVPADGAEMAVSPGIWTYEVDTRGSRAMFGRANTDALVVLRCDRAARRVFLSVPGNDQGTLTLRASSTLKGFAARPTGATPPYVAVEIAPTDSILDALAFSRGRFTVALGARQTVVPTWPEFTRVIEDCRS